MTGQALQTYKVVFRDEERQSLVVKASELEGHMATDTRDSYVFKVGREIMAVVPKCQVLYFERIDAD